MSRRYLCISCWRERPLEELFYTCSECEGSDEEVHPWIRSSETGEARPVASLRRPWWRRLSFEAFEPACPRHPEAELQLYCPPSCNSPITRAAEVDRRGTLAVGFAGPTSAGKTLFTLAAIHRLRDARVDGQRVSLLGLGDTEERFGKLESSLFTDLLQPTHTSEQGDGKTSFAWEVAVSEDGGGRRGRDALVAVCDLAGETWGKPGHEPHELLDSYLTHVGGVVFLVDGASVADDLGLESSDAWNAAPRPGDRGARDRQWLRWLIERLGDRTREVDLALTISKGDLLWSHDEWSALKPTEPDVADTTQLQRALDATGRGDLPASAQSHFRRTGLFIASSLGFRPGENDVDADGRLLRPPKPWNVEAPVLWLLGQRIRGLS